MQTHNHFVTTFEICSSNLVIRKRYQTTHRKCCSSICHWQCFARPLLANLPKIQNTPFHTTWPNSVRSHKFCRNFV